MKHNFKILFTSSVLALILLLGSCSKPGDDAGATPPVPIPKPDTLASGWKKITVDPTGSFTDIFFNSATNGYLAGKKIYRSTDGGLTWKIAINKAAGNIAVTTDGKIFLVNLNDTIFRSADGGATLTGFGTTGAAGFDAFFIDNNKGYYITSAGLYFTADGGITWTKLNTPDISFPGTYSSVFFAGDGSGIALTSGGVYRTNGSSLNWKKSIFNGGLNYKQFESAYITPDNTIYLTNRFRELYRSADGGTTFNMLKQFPSGPDSFSDIHFVDNNTGYYSIGNRIYKTTDAGASWNVVVALGNAVLSEIHFTDANHGWACGNNGDILVFN